MPFIQPTDSRWKNLLSEEVHEFYHTPEYVTFDAKLLKGRPLAWYEKQNDSWILIPLIKREIPRNITNGKPLFDLISPYGYPGILTNASDNIFQMLTRFSLEACKLNLVSTFIRLNPVFNRFIYHESPDIRHIIHGQVVCLNMALEYSERSKSYLSKSRKYIKSLKNNNFSINVNGWSKVEDFIEIYNNTMDRQGASQYYYFPKEYYLKLKELNKSSLNVELVLCENETGETVAGSIFCSNSNTMEYHLSATHIDYVKKSPVYLIFDDIFKRYSGKIKYLNLGGGLQNTKDSLFKFKEKFGKEYLKFSTLRLVHDRKRYNNLCSFVGETNFNEMNDFFPLYRKGQ